jgi:hypothetical protein
LQRVVNHIARFLGQREHVKGIDRSHVESLEVTRRARTDLCGTNRTRYTCIF